MRISGFGSSEGRALYAYTHALRMESGAAGEGKGKRRASEIEVGAGWLTGRQAPCPDSRSWVPFQLRWMWMEVIIDGEFLF